MLNFIVRKTFLKHSTHKSKLKKALRQQNSKKKSHGSITIKTLTEQETWKRPGRELRDGKRFPVIEKETDFRLETLLLRACFNIEPQELNVKN